MVKPGFQAVLIQSHSMSCLPSGNVSAGVDVSRDIPFGKRDVVVRQHDALTQRTVSNTGYADNAQPGQHETGRFWYDECRNRWHE